MLIKPSVWTIAGFDPSGGAGILADHRTLSALEVPCFAIITAMTAQNGSDVSPIQPIGAELVEAQIGALKKLGWPAVIKIGMLPNAQMIRCLQHCLKDFSGSIVYDPVIISSTGQALIDVTAIPILQTSWFKHVNYLTPNLHEAAWLLSGKIITYQDRLNAAKSLCQQGIKEVILKGGHDDTGWAQDLWTNGNQHAWLSLPRLPIGKTHGTGCVFSAALAGFLALGYRDQDPVILAKMAIHGSLKSAYRAKNGVQFPTLIYWQNCLKDLPNLTTEPVQTPLAAFLPLERQIGLYAIVKDVAWLEKIVAVGVRTIQLRIKNQSIAYCRHAIQQAILIAKHYNVQLFINDYWQLAIEQGAYGVHLGYEDLQKCDINSLRASGLRLGISTHNYTELATAHAVRPSYIAFGPIFPTTSKQMRFDPQGILKLKQWRRSVSCPLVAIGGITLNNLSEVLACQIDGVAVISALTKATDLAATCQQFLRHFRNE